MSYKEIINGLKPFEYSQYRNVSSYEKLMNYAAYSLEKMGVPLTFNYICIASFKMFPERFCCDEEFEEFPSVDRLNRTMMHLKYTDNPCLTGKINTGYNLTKYGRIDAATTEAIIGNAVIDKGIKAPVVDGHKKGLGGDYLKLIQSDGYKKYLETGEIEPMFLWNFYGATPFTQLKTIKDNLSLVKQYANDSKDLKCLEFVKKLEEITRV